MQCTKEGCANKALARGLCSGHYKTDYYFKARPLYAIWESMIARCERPSHKNYADYGGRGITVCERWHDYKAFEADMSPRPDPRMSLDRRDNSLGYSPDNCRWATPAEQAANRRPQKMRRDNTSGQTNWRQLPSGRWELRGTNGVHIKTAERPE